MVDFPIADWWPSAERPELYAELDGQFTKPRGNRLQCVAVKGAGRFALTRRSAQARQARFICASVADLEPGSRAWRPRPRRRSALSRVPRASAQKEIDEPPGEFLLGAADPLELAA
jgi:hypothetical protein